MFLSTAILVLQEILEAALLVSVLLVLSRQLTRTSEQNLRISLSWLPVAIGAGLVGSWMYAYFFPEISQWFDDVGLEITNAAIQGVILLALMIFCFMFTSVNCLHRTHRLGQLTPVLMAVMVSLGIVREVSEIILYLNGVLANPTNVTPTVLGASLAAGIGVSSGIVLYFLLLSLSVAWSYRLSMLLLALFAGNLASQIVILLTQADWIPYSRELWDSSAFIPEFTITGQLLYALVGYEANPSLIQVVCYCCSAMIIVVSPLFLHAWRKATGGSANV